MSFFTEVCEFCLVGACGDWRPSVCVCDDGVQCQLHFRRGRRCMADWPLQRRRDLVSSFDYRNSLAAFAGRVSNSLHGGYRARRTVFNVSLRLPPSSGLELCTFKACSRHMNWTDLQQVDPVTWHVHGSHMLALCSIGCSKTRTVGAQSVLVL